MRGHLGLFGKRAKVQKTFHGCMPPQRARPMLEGLEDRTLLSITFSGPDNSGICTMTTTVANDQFQIQLKPGDPATIEFNENLSFPPISTVVSASLAGITGIRVLGEQENDQLIINEGNGLVGKITPLPISFTGGTALDTLILEGTATGPVTETFAQGGGQGMGTLDITNGAISSTIALISVGRIQDTMTAGTLTVNTPADAVDNFVQIHDGPMVNGLQTDTFDVRNLTIVGGNLDDEDLGALSSPTSASPAGIDDDPNLFAFGTIESVSFANKSNVVVRGEGSNNFYLVTVTKPAAGFQSLTLDGVTGTNVAAIRSLPASVKLTLINIQVHAADNGSVFIEEMYEERLGRLASETELAAWLKVFQTLGQQAVAVGIEQSSEARTDLVKAFYLRYLGRPAENGEEQGWVRLLVEGETEERIIAGIVSSSEFYARAQTLISSGTPDQRYVQALYQVLLNRSGSASEVKSWVGALPALGRFGVALGIVESAEFRSAVITAYYIEFLQRSPDASGLAAWVGSGETLEQIRLGFESSGEFLADG